MRTLHSRCTFFEFAKLYSNSQMYSKNTHERYPCNANSASSFFRSVRTDQDQPKSRKKLAALSTPACLSRIDHADAGHTTDDNSSPVRLCWATRPLAAEPSAAGPKSPALRRRRYTSLGLGALGTLLRRCTTYGSNPSPPFHPFFASRPNNKSVQIEFYLDFPALRTQGFNTCMTTAFLAEMISPSFF